MTSDMMAYYYTDPVETCSHVSRTPVSWRIKNQSSDDTWDLEVKKISYTAEANVPIKKVTEEVYTPITRPLYGLCLSVENRESKSNCSALVETSSATAFPTGYGSSLSILGAAVFDGKGDLWQDSGANSRVRVDSIKSVLAKASAKKRNCLAAQFVSTGVMHKAGLRGSFVVYTIQPVVNLHGTWYDCESLKSTSFKGAHVKDVRYLTLCRKALEKCGKEDFTMSFSDSVDAVAPVNDEYDV